MKPSPIPYVVIAFATVFAVIAGYTFPGIASLAWGILCGAVMTLGVNLAQADAYSEGQDNPKELDS